MSTHKHIERVCWAVLAVTLAVTLAATILFMCVAQSGAVTAMGRVMGYENTLFDNSYVHTLDITMDDWDGFLETCENEEYALCSVTIDGETLHNVAIRAKGNTSLSQVSAQGSDRYSFKLEFDHYDSAITYHGLDKLALNNLIQDNTMMKDYLVYQMMEEFGVDAPLCSFIYITVNGEDWGLYLAVEAIEDSFLARNYGGEGELYKPDTTSMGGGRGNGRDFNVEDLDWNDAGGDIPFDRENTRGPMGRDNGESDAPQMPEGMPTPPEQAAGGDVGARPFGGEGKGAGGPGGMGSSDVKLQYIDDAPESYTNIFGNAKTDVSSADKARLIASLKSLSAGEELEKVLDMEEVLRYFVVHTFSCNGDSYTGSLVHNYYLHEGDGRLSMIPWDYNLAFGSFDLGGSSNGATAAVNSPIDSPVTGGDVTDRPMVAWIFSDDYYTELYHQYYLLFVQTFADLSQRIANTAALIRPYVERDPTKFCTLEEFDAAAAALADFCTLRLQSIAGQLAGTIPSTSEGQSADSSTLVDASSVDASAMGNMGFGKGGGFAGKDGNFTPPTEGTAENGTAPAGGASPGGTSAPPDAVTAPTGKGGG